MPRDETEAAYFALLRARDELDALRRYGEYLADEQRRIRRFLAEGAALADGAPPRLVGALRHTDVPLTEALRARMTLIAEEAERLPEREAAAAAFVDECERAHAALRGRH